MKRAVSCLLLLLLIQEGRAEETHHPDRQEPQVPSVEFLDERHAALILGVPPSLYAWHKTTTPCEDLSMLANEHKPLRGAASTTSDLYALPCFTREGKPHYKLYLFDTGEAGGIQPLLFASWSRKGGWRGVDILAAVTYEENARRLSGLAGDRADDCPSFGVWSFDSLPLRLVAMRAPEKCLNASADPRLWTSVPLP